ncbi:MAG: YceI family protein [Croceitalea sp.]|nr:YceI family protein [Croceitalea sp.]
MIKKVLLLGMLLLQWQALVSQTNLFDKATVTFEFVTRGVKGTFDDFESKTKINWSALDESYFEGSVATGSIDTNNWLRDWHLKSKKYFSADNHPRIYFRAKTVSIKGVNLVVKGNLTIKGIQKPMTLVFEKAGDKFIGKGQLYSTDFDINIKRKREDNLVRVQVVFDVPNPL